MTPNEYVKRAFADPTWEIGHTIEAAPRQACKLMHNGRSLGYCARERSGEWSWQAGWMRGSAASRSLAMEAVDRAAGHELARVRRELRGRFPEVEFLKALSIAIDRDKDADERRIADGRAVRVKKGDRIRLTYNTDNGARVEYMDSDRDGVYVCNQWQVRAELVAPAPQPR